MPDLRVLYFGTYDRGVGRNAVLRDGLRAAGVEVREAHVPLWPSTTAKLTAARSRRGLLRTAGRVLLAWPQLLRAHAAAQPYDVLLVGHTAHLDLPLARLLATTRGVPLVFDPLVSVGETLRDRGLLAPGAWRLALLERLERALFALPDHVLVDTAVHARALGREVGLEPGRAVVLPAGAPAGYRRHARPYRPRRDRCRVVYFGQYIPLHGVEVMLRAAALLADRPDITFELVGRGQELPAARRLAARLGLRNVRFREGWWGQAVLAERFIAPADLCLGAFGAQPKAERVVPHKVYAALAAGRPVLTAETPAVRELLRPGHEVATVPPADPAALAAAVAALAAQPERRARLAAAGQAAYDARFAPPVLGAQLRAQLRSWCRPTPAEDPPWAAHVGPRHAWRTDLLARTLLDAAPDGVLLDAGCGAGRLAAQLAAAERLTMACDRDLRLLRAARRTLAQAETLADAETTAEAVVPAAPHLLAADVTALPFVDGMLAGVAAGEVLEHVPDDRRALRELRRVLAPGGALAVTAPAGPGRFGPLDRAVGHVRRYDRATLAGVLGAAGLHVERLVGWGFPFGRLYDRLVQQPALRLRRRAPRGDLARLVGRLGRSRPAHALWRALFALDARLPAGERGSGWLAVARRLAGRS